MDGNGRRSLRRVPATLLVLFVGAQALAGERTPEEAASAAVAAAKAKDPNALRRLAASPEPDPWLVVDALLARDRKPVADAFARATGGPDAKALVDYATRATASDTARSARARRAEAALAAGRAEAVLEATEASEGGTDVASVRLLGLRARALAQLRREGDAADAFAAAAEAAVALGWGAEALRTLRVGVVALADFADALPSFRAASRWAELADALPDEADRAAARAAVAKAGERASPLDRKVVERERARRAFLAKGDRREADEILMDVGDSQRQRGDLVHARAAFEEALRAAEGRRDDGQRWRALHGLGTVAYFAGDDPRALELLGAALEVPNRTPWSEALSRTALGLVRKRLGDLDGAERDQRRAMEIHAAKNRRNEVARLHNNLSGVYLARGELRRARDEARLALAMHTEEKDEEGRGTSLMTLASVEQAMGLMAACMAHLEEAAAVFERSGMLQTRIFAELQLADLRFRRDDAERAAAAARRVLETAERLGDAGLADGARNLLAEIANASGDVAGALAHVQQRLARAEAAGEVRATLAVLLEGQRLWRGAGHADKALEWGRRAIGQAEAIGDPESVISAAGRLAETFNHLDRPAEAEPLARRALALAREKGYRGRVMDSAGQLAASLYAQRRWKEATMAAREAADALRDFTHAMGEESGAAVRGDTSWFLDVGLDAAIRERDLEQVLFFLETGRAQGFLGALGGAAALERAETPADLRRREIDARGREALAAATTRAAESDSDREAVRRSRAAYDVAREEHRAALEAVELHRAVRGGVAATPPATLEVLRRALEPGEAMVLFWAPPKSIPFALVLTRETQAGAFCERLLDPAAAVEALRTAARDPSNDPTAALGALRKDLIEPLALPAGTTRCIVSPDGDLSLVPFGWLMADVEVTSVPSGSAFAWLARDRARRGSGVLALGDPDTSAHADADAQRAYRGGLALSRLAASAKEATTVGDVVRTGAQASEPGLAEAIGARARWSAVHLACHGLLDPQNPTLSSLALTPTEHDDGFLTALEVFGMRVPADLVVLSACETGRGKVFRGEGLVGLQRAFFYAGTPRVIGSLWRVDDEATFALMKRFYEQWNPKDGSPPRGAAAALRSAQEHVRSQKRWEHPYYWAAWSLWGLP